jgi:hypothetical protein
MLLEVLACISVFQYASRLTRSTADDGGDDAAMW